MVVGANIVRPRVFALLHSLRAHTVRPYVILFSICTAKRINPSPLCHTGVQGGIFMSVFKKILLLLAIIGGINWGIYGIWGFNAVGWLLGGSLSWLSRTVFILVGLASLCLIPSLCMGDSCKGKEA